MTDVELAETYVFSYFSMFPGPYMLQPGLPTTMVSCELPDHRCVYLSTASVL